MGYEAINRRQFLVRGGGAAMAVGLFARLPPAARAAGVLATSRDKVALTTSELNVVDGLIAAICVGNGQPGTALGSLGLLTPAEFASAYASCDTETQTAISAVLAAIDHGPVAQLFSLLGADAQAEFIGGTFAELDLYEASDRDIAVLDALSGSTNALAATLHPGLGSATPPAQPAVSVPQPQPFTGASSTQYIFSQTLLCGLTLVSQPLWGDIEMVDLPKLSLSTATALAQWLEHRSIGSRPSRQLVTAITADLSGAVPEPLEHPVWPGVALSRALTVWLSAARRISL